MNFIFDHPWLAGITLAVAGTIFIFLVGNFLAVFVSWVQIRKLIRKGRTIKWADVLTRCKAEQVVVVIELRTRPQKVWFLVGHDESTFFSRKGSPHYKGLLVLNPPDAGRIFKEVEEAGGRVAKIDMNSVLW
jgi:hypothetical protein